MAMNGCGKWDRPVGSGEGLAALLTIFAAS